VSQIIGANPVLDEHPVRTIIKREDLVNNISGELDISIAQIKPKASFSLIDSNSNNSHTNTLMQTILGSVPPTDTRVYLIDETFLNELFNKYQKKFFYIGNAYLSKVKIPLIFRHFGSGEFGMGNDAYHILVTAKTGGGKSTISKMMSICYARYPKWLNSL
jgi:hypothetical protein